MTPRSLVLATAAPIATLIVVCLVTPREAHLWASLAALVWSVIGAYRVTAQIKDTCAAAEKRGADDAMNEAITAARALALQRQEQEPQ